MSRVDILAAAAQSYPVKFMEATRAYSKSPSVIVCIFEGEDEKYFSCRLSMEFGNQGWKGINSGGRKAVLDLHGLLSTHDTYKNYKSVGFIDNDYDEPVVNPDPENIYVTPCYSVENLYASPVCLSNILSAEFKVSEVNELHDEHKLCLQIFKTRLDEVCTYLLEFNSWAKSRVIQEEKGMTPIKLFLNDATIDKLVDINLDCSAILYNPDDITSVFKKADVTLLCNQSVAEARMSFSPEVRLSMFRGKQQLEAFRLFLAALKLDFLLAGTIIFHKKGKLKTDLASEDSDLLSELSQYAETPDCLRAFLRKHSLGATTES
jgi:hypothetical protein